MLGGDGLTRATEVAILNANYIAARLDAALPGALHRQRTAASRTSASSTSAPIKAATGIAEIDIAKRLMDYGFHAPTCQLPGRRHDDGRTDRIGIEGRTRPLHRAR